MCYQFKCILWAYNRKLVLTIFVLVLNLIMQWSIIFVHAMTAQQSRHLWNYCLIGLVNFTLVLLGFLKDLKYQIINLLRNELRMQCSVAQKLLEKLHNLPFTAPLIMQWSIIFVHAMTAQQSRHLWNYCLIGLVNFTLVLLGFLKDLKYQIINLLRNELRMQCSVAQKLLEKLHNLPFTAPLCWTTSCTHRFKISLVW